MKEKIFWLFTILFIVGTVSNYIATEGSRDSLIAKKGNSLEIDKMRFDEGDLNLSISIPKKRLTQEKLGEHCEKPNEILLKYEINKGAKTDVIEITRKMNYAPWFSKIKFQIR